MAKSTSYDFQKSDRKKIVENCKECDGHPPVENFELQGMCGQYCSNASCMMVVNWKRVGQPTKFKEKKIFKEVVNDNMTELNAKELDKDSIILTIESEPGNNTINFKDLNI